MTILPIWSEPASLRDWDPDAPGAAQQVAKLITSRMSGLMVEHIGSTAVPGCVGKGVLDVMVLYPKRRLSETRELLDALGFQRQTSRDPWPEERPMRTGAIEFAGKRYRIHAHVIAEDSPEAAELRNFRDKLRGNAELREAYVARKRTILAEGITDPVDYSYAKGEFIQKALCLVRTWR